MCVCVYRERVMLFGPLPSWTWIDTQRGEKGKKKTRKEKGKCDKTGGREK